MYELFSFLQFLRFLLCALLISQVLHRDQLLVRRLGLIECQLLLERLDLGTEVAELLLLLLLGSNVVLFELFSLFEVGKLLRKICFIGFHLLDALLDVLLLLLLKLFVIVECHGVDAAVDFLLKVLTLPVTSGLDFPLYPAGACVEEFIGRAQVVAAVLELALACGGVEGLYLLALDALDVVYLGFQLLQHRVLRSLVLCILQRQDVVLLFLFEEDCL